MELDYKMIGDRIRSYRHQKGVTQEKMSEDLYLSVGFISQLERGICKVSLDTLANISEYLNCSISSILDGCSPSDSSFRQTDFNSLYASLPFEDQKLFYVLIETYVKQRTTE